MTARWYALCSKPHKERILWRQLRAKGYEVFYPRLYLPTRTVRGYRCRSYFPGYLFVKVDFGKVSLSAFQWMPHSEGLVCIDGIPAYVPDNLIGAISRHVNEINETSKKLSKEPHQLDESNFDGNLDVEKQILDPSLSDSERVRALVRALNDLKASPELSSVKE